MSLPNGVTKRPVNDLTSFDVSKHSPEQIARLFARWKEQCRRVERRKEAVPSRARSLRIMPRFQPSSAAADVPASDALKAPQSQPSTPHYSADFAAILGDSADGAAAQRIKNLRFRLPGVAARAGIARSRLRWALAGAASVIAVTAVAGTVYWPAASSLPRQATASTAAPALTEPAIEPAPEPQMALALLPAMTDRAGPEPLVRQQLADLAAWPAMAEPTKAPLPAMLKPDTIQTASSGMDEAELASSTESALDPTQIPAKSVQEVATATGDAAREADVEEEAAPARTASISSELDSRGRERPEVSDPSGMSVAGLQGDQSIPGGSNGGGGGAPSGGGESGGKSGAGERGGSGGSDRGASGGGETGGGESGAGADPGSGESGSGESGGSEGGEGGESGGGGSGGEDGDGGESGGDGDSEGGDSDGESGEGSLRGGLRDAVGGLLGGARDVIGGLGKALGGKDNGADGGKDKGGGKRGGNG